MNTPYCNKCINNIITTSFNGKDYHIKCGCEKVDKNQEYIKSLPDNTLGKYIPDVENKKQIFIKTCEFPLNNKHWLMFLGMDDDFNYLAIACFRNMAILGKDIWHIDWQTMEEIPSCLYTVEVLLILNYREMDDNSPVLLKKILEGRKDKKTIFTSKYSIEVFRELDAELADLIEQTTEGDYINYLIDL